MTQQAAVDVSSMAEKHMEHLTPSSKNKKTITNSHINQSPKQTVNTNRKRFDNHADEEKKEIESTTGKELLKTPQGTYHYLSDVVDELFDNEKKTPGSNIPIFDDDIIPPPKQTPGLNLPDDEYDPWYCENKDPIVYDEYGLEIYHQKPLKDKIKEIATYATISAAQGWRGDDFVADVKGGYAQKWTIIADEYGLNVQNISELKQMMRRISNDPKRCSKKEFLKKITDYVKKERLRNYHQNTLTPPQYTTYGGGRERFYLKYPFNKKITRL